MEPSTGDDATTGHDLSEPASVSADVGDRGYPITFRFDAPQRVARWRPLVNWLLAIPHLIVLSLLRVAAEVLAVLAWFAILFTGKMPPTFAGFLAMYIRYEQRVWTYAGFLREEYPPFSFDSTPADPGDDPRTKVDVVPALERRNRLTVAFRVILFIPWAIVLAVYAIGALAVFIVAWFAVLFTGRWPDGMRTFVIKVARYYVRTAGFLLLLTDEYPPFALD